MTAPASQAGGLSRSSQPAPHAAPNRRATCYPCVRAYSAFCPQRRQRITALDVRPSER